MSQPGFVWEIDWVVDPITLDQPAEVSILQLENGIGGKLLTTFVQLFHHFLLSLDIQIPSREVLGCLGFCCQIGLAFAIPLPISAPKSIPKRHLFGLDFFLMTVSTTKKQQLHIDGFKESFEKSIETASTTQEANRSWQMKVYFEIPGCLR